MKRARFKVYEARDGFRWRLLAANNRLIAESGEAYTRQSDAWRAVDRTIEAVGWGSYVRESVVVK